MERINKIISPQTQEQKEKTPNSIINKKGEITTDTSDTQKTVIGY